MVRLFPLFKVVVPAAIVHAIYFPVLEHGVATADVALPRLVVNDGHFLIHRTMQHEPRAVQAFDQVIVDKKL